MQKLDASGTSQVKRRFRWQQYVAAGIATLAALCGGSVIGWSAPVLPYLQQLQPEPGRGNASEAASGDALTDEQASWVGALVSAGGLLGALPAGWAADRLGRRALLLGLGALLAAAWVALAAARNTVWLLLAARVAAGVATGGVTVVVPLYTEEVAEPAVRGALGSYLDLMLAVGILWAYGAGALLSYEWLAAASAALPLVFCGLFALMPESPVHLLARGRWAQAERALAWLRGADSSCGEIQQELRLMHKMVEGARSGKGKSKGAGGGPGAGPGAVAVVVPPPPPAPNTPLRGCGAAEGGRATRRACIAVFGLMMFQQLSGIDAILFYTVDVFRVSGSSLSPLTATVVTGVIQAVATAAASLLVDRVGRRPLLQFSAASMALAHAALALDWLPIFSVNLFLVAFAAGLGPLPWFMMAELLPPATKRWAAGAAVGLNWTLSFLVTKWFGQLMHDVGTLYTYVSFCIVCLLLGLFVTFFVPETKGKTREEIQMELAIA